MAHYLVYWETWSDYGPDRAKQLVLEQGYGSSNLKAVSPGDVIWVVVRHPGQTHQWRLAQKFQVRDVYADESNGSFRWRARADPRESIFFDIDQQQNLEPVLTQLSFDTGKRIKATGALIGQFIQSVRRLAPSDAVLLNDHFRFESQESMSGDVDLEIPRRRTLSINQIYRNPQHVLWIKELYRNQCQVCGDSIRLPGGRMYSEAHHIRPLGVPHNGPDEPQNMLCVCPNCHVRLDYGAIELVTRRLRVDPRHKLSDEQCAYHNKLIYGRVG